MYFWECSQKDQTWKRTRKDEGERSTKDELLSHQGFNHDEIGVVYKKKTFL